MSDTLPKGWTIAKLGEIGVCVTGNTPSKSNPLFYGNEIPFIKPPQVNNGLISESSEFLSSEGGKKARLLPTNSILVTCIGNLGRVGINKTPIAFNQQINAIIPSEVYEPKLLFYQAMSSQFKTQLESYSAATTVAIVNKGNFEKIIIPLPPLNEQKRILAKLEQLLTDLDKGIEYLETTKQQLKVYRQAVLKWAFEGKLTNGDVKDGELKSDKLGAYIEKIEAGKSIKCEERPPSKSEYGILKVSAVTWGKYDENESKTITDNRFLNESFLVREGDFIFSRANTLDLIGAVVIARNVSKNVMLSDKTLRVIFSKQIIPKYALYYLRSKEGRKQIQFYSNGNQESMRNIGQIGIKSISIPIPSNTDLQIQIVQQIESRLSVCDKIEETIENSLQQAEALRLSIIKKAFEGKLVPQDPNDEPAEQLLERIKALRHSSAKTTTRVRSQPAATNKKKKGKIMSRRKVK